MKVKVENFQSIKSAELEIKGLTVITGENSIGKSALARALSGVFTNTRGDAYVRNGEKSLSVEVSFEDGNQILWEKGKGVNQYTVNGKFIPKVGSSVPDEVKDIGVKAVEVDGKELHPQIAKQFQNIFLLDLPPSALSSALSDVDTIQKLEKASSTARSEMRDIKSRLKVKREDLEEARNKSLQFYDFDYNQVLKVESLEEEKSKAESRCSTVESLAKKKSRLNMAEVILERAHTTPIPPPLSNLPNIDRLVSLKRAKTKAYVTSMMISVGLEGEVIPSMPDLLPIEKIEKLVKAKDRLSSAKEILGKASSIEIPPTPLINEISSISLIEKKIKLRYGLEVVQEEITKIESEVKKITAEIQKHACPTCLRSGGSHEGH